MGLYGEVKDGFGPTTPERLVWDQATKKKHEIYNALRPDSFCDWSVNNRMEELAREDTFEMMRFWYNRAVDEQRAELRQYKKKLKGQLPQIEPTPLTIEEDLSHRPEPIKA